MAAHIPPLSESIFVSSQLLDDNSHTVLVDDRPSLYNNWTYEEMDLALNELNKTGKTLRQVATEYGRAPSVIECAGEEHTVGHLNI